MKPLNKLFLVFLFVVIAFNYSGNFAKAQSGSGVYAGGPIYYGRNYSINELKNSGFTFLVIWTIHINSNGDLNLNGEFLLCKNGSYVGESSYPYFDNDMATLKSSSSSINRIEISVGAWGSDAFDNVRDLINSQGTGSGSILYRNFQALKNKIPQIDAINFDDEKTYHASSAKSFANMLGNIGYKVTLCPYNNRSFWQNVAGSWAVDRVYLQCYAGGSSNSPCTWDNYFSDPVWPGVWSRDYSPSGVENKMNSWQNSCNIKGGWMWLYDDFDNSSKVAQYASAINNALNIGGGGGGGIQHNHIYNIKNVNSGKCLDVKSQSTSNGANVQQWDCWGGNNQKWLVQSVSGGYTIKAQHSGKCLDVKYNSTADGANIQQWGCSGANNQKWKIISVGGGKYKVESVRSGKVLDVYKKSTANGANVQQWGYAGQNNQKWTFIDLGHKSAEVHKEIIDESVPAIPFSIYPNPVKDVLHISGIESGTIIEIYNLVGEKVMTTKQTKKINIQELTSGLYFIKLTDGTNLKFIKE